MSVLEIHANTLILFKARKPHDKDKYLFLFSAYYNISMRCFPFKIYYAPDEGKYILQL